MGRFVRGMGAVVLAGMAQPLIAQTAPVPPASQPDPEAQTPRTVDTPATASQAAAVPGGTPTTSGRANYDAAYFAQYAPATALQMVERVPGFVIQETDTEVRGFAQAAGNVVINGQRPSSKTDGIRTILSRIPAGRVQRVEVAPGESFGAEYAGKAQVVNLVMTAAGGMSGTITAGLRRDFTGQLLPEGSASALIRTGKSTFNLAATILNQRTSDAGPDIVTALPSGALIERREKRNDYNAPNGALTAAWEYNGGAHRTAHLNVRYAADRLRLHQDNDVFPVSGPQRADTLDQRYNQDDYEIGGDITRPLAGGGLKAIGLATRRNRDYRDASLLRTTAGAIVGGFAQDLNDRLDERVARLVWNRQDLGGWTVETGGEAVLNRLRSRVDLFGLGAGGVPSRIDLPVDDATVTERRGELFVNGGRALSKALRLDVGLTYEHSRLTVSGDATAKRTLAFWKPRATLDWRVPGSKWRAQLSVKRTVAQLRFEDFISSAELSNERVNGGNPDLLPQRAWESLLTVERPILGDGLAKLELGYNRLSLVQDRVPTPDGFDAPGNLGNGTILIVRPRIDAPLGRFGIKGGRLTLYASYVKTNVRDPYTLEDRPFSGNSSFFSEASFRQDLGEFAWGVSLFAGTPFTIYRRNELDKFTDPLPFVTAFAEWRPDPKTTVTLNLRNLTDAKVTRVRTFFAPDRRTAAPFQREERLRNQHIVPQLTIKRNFG